LLLFSTDSPQRHSNPAKQAPNRRSTDVALISIKTDEAFFDAGKRNNLGCCHFVTDDLDEKCDVHSG
jgi:hypothetical protein